MKLLPILILLGICCIDSSTTTGPLPPRISMADRTTILNSVNGARQILQSGKLLGSTGSTLKSNPPGANLVKFTLDPCYDNMITYMSSSTFNPDACFEENITPACDFNTYVFSKCTPPGSNYTYSIIAQDTINALSADVVDGVVWRVNRDIKGNCFYFPNCNKFSGNVGYIDCINLNNNACVWAWNYIAQFLSAQWLTFDCVRLNHKGPKGSYQYLCFGRGVNENYSLLPDQPFIQSTPCSLCPYGYNVCSPEGLCTTSLSEIPREGEEL